MRGALALTLPLWAPLLMAGVLIWIAVVCPIAWVLTGEDWTGI